MGTYLSNFWPEFIEARELHGSISSSLTEMKSAEVLYWSTPGCTGFGTGGCLCLGPQPMHLLDSSRAKEYQDYVLLDMLEVGIESVSTAISVCLLISWHLHPEQVLVCDWTGNTHPGMLAGEQV